MNCPNLLTAEELAKELRVSVETIWRYTREKRIPFIQLGSRQYRYDASAVVQALQRKADIPVRETSARYGTAGPLTYEDYARLPEEPGYKLEVLDGWLVKEPSPVVHHQRVSRRLQQALVDHFAASDPQGEVFGAPLDVSLSDRDVVQPDLFYVPGKDSQIVGEVRVQGVPALIVEILSSQNRRRDRVHKMEIYRRAGVEHYWIVDPEDSTIEAFTLADGRYYVAAAGMDGQTFTHPDFPKLSIDLEQVWSRPQDATTIAGRDSEL